MDEVATCRQAARDAVRDVEPERLRHTMDDLLAEASMTPGVLTLRTARAASTADDEAVVTVTVEDTAPEADGGVETGAAAAASSGDAGVASIPDRAAERAAGVQLIYEGLRVIRRLARDDPWTPTPGTAATDHTDENLAVLAADVLVSRGFALLARTDAADRAVQTVRNFGRDQTLARTDGGGTATTTSSVGTDPGHDLEVDVLRLALATGTTCVEGVSPAPSALSTVAAVARSTSCPFPPAETSLAGVHVRAERSTTGVGVDGDGGATYSSATDP